MLPHISLYHCHEHRRFFQNQHWVSVHFSLLTSSASQANLLFISRDAQAAASAQNIFFFHCFAVTQVTCSICAMQPAHC